MNDSEQLLGQRFSHVYLDRGKPANDSSKMRLRLAALMGGIPDLKGFAPEVPKELGVAVPTSAYQGYWPEFFRDCEIEVALDTATIAYRYLVAKRTRGMVDLGAGDKFAKEVARIFAEERVAYRIDSRGGVHPLVDPEFDVNREASIAALRGTRYANVLDAVERAQTSLAEIPPDGKGAIRSTFAAAEGLFKLLFPKEPKLTGEAAKRQLASLVQRIYAPDTAALRATSKLVAGFAEWIDSAHNYRHEQGSEEIAQPPFELAVNLISLGNSFIRWLAELDGKQIALAKRAPSG